MCVYRQKYKYKYLNNRLFSLLKIDAWVTGNFLALVIFHTYLSTRYYLYEVPVFVIEVDLQHLRYFLDNNN